MLCSRALQGAGKTRSPDLGAGCTDVFYGEAHELYVYDTFLYVLNFSNCFLLAGSLGAGGISQ